MVWGSLNDTTFIVCPQILPYLIAFPNFLMALTVVTKPFSSRKETFEIGSTISKEQS